MENKKMDFQITDDRRINFYIIDNEIIDSLKLCPVAICMYNCIIRFERNEELYFSVNWFCKKFKVGKQKGLKIFNHLLELELFEIVGTTNQGARKLKIKSVKDNKWFQMKPEAVLNKTTMVSNETGGGSKQNSNNTNNILKTKNKKQDNPDKSGLHNYIIDKFDKAYLEFSKGKKYPWKKADFGIMKSIIKDIKAQGAGDPKIEFDERFEIFLKRCKGDNYKFLTISPGKFKYDFANLIEPIDENEIERQKMIEHLRNYKV